MTIVSKQLSEKIAKRRREASELSDLLSSNSLFREFYQAGKLVTGGCRYDEKKRRYIVIPERMENFGELIREIGR